MTSRVCKRCGESKPLCELVKTPDCKFGRRALCKKCAVILQQEGRDPVKKAAYDKKRREENLLEARSYDKERAKLPHRRAAHNEETRKRRAKLKDSVPLGYDKEGVVAMYQMAQKITNITGGKDAR